MTYSPSKNNGLLEKVIKAPLRATIRTLWMNNNRDWLIILAYHRVSDEYNPQIHMPMTWNNTVFFEQQIRYIKKNYKIVKLHSALNELENGTLTGPCIAITIDDGDISVKTNIAPILERHDCPATVFITSSYLQCERLHFSFVARYIANSPDPRLSKKIDSQTKDLVKRLRMTDDESEYQEKRYIIESMSDLIPDKQSMFLDNDDLLNLDPMIFDIGLHGDEHQRFSMMDATWQENAIKKNISDLDHLENYCPIFAIPFGSSRDWNAHTVDACIKHNIYMLTCTNGINQSKDIIYKRVFADNTTVNTLIDRTITGCF